MGKVGRSFNLFLITCLVTLLACSADNAANQAPESIGDSRAYFPDDSIEWLNVPPGFRIHIFADDVPNARSMCLTESGILFVGNRSGNSVYALQDTNFDYRADLRWTIASGLTMPNGVEFLDGDLFVAEVNRILRFPDILFRLDNPPQPEVVIDTYPTDRHHGWKFIRFGPDGYLYVPVGAPCNVCLEQDSIYASITRIRPDGSELEIYAHGVRNTVGFDWDPITDELWFTDNGRDMMGDNIPPDELNHAPRAGLHFGFPFCHGGDIPDPGFGEDRPCEEFRPPAQNLGPHVAALGMRFYTGDNFPARYKNSIFIAEHGSWNRSEKIGYRVMFVELNNDREVISYEVFAEGWLQSETDVRGRPVDIEQMPDGSLLVSDDYSGVIYRIVYGGD